MPLFMKQLILFLLLINLAGFSYGQSFKEEYATKLSNTLQFVEAYPVWTELAEKSLKNNVINGMYMRRAVEAAYNSEQYTKALFWSEKLTASPEINESDWLTYFSLLQITSNHTRLTGAVDSALVRLPQSKLIQNWKQQVPLILKQLTVNSDYTLAPFREIKTGEEFCAVPYKDGFVLVSNRRNTGFVNREYAWTGQFFTDLISINGATEIEKDQLWKEVKRTNPHDGPIAFSPDFKKAILTVNQEEIDEVNKIKYARLALKIYTQGADGGWKEAIEFPFNNKTYSVGHGVLDLEGNLIFASDKPGGFGGVDLYKSSWKEGAWSEPINLGDKMNTAGDEVFPFVSNTGVLYFSSNGWPGNGGLDVFYQENKNAPAVHIGNPINTNADDFGIYIDDNTGKGLMSSNRNNFKDEIYSISKPVYKIEAEISLTTCDNKVLSKQIIVAKNLNTLTEEKLTTDEKGKVTFKPALNSRYQFSYAGEGNIASCTTEKTFDKEGKHTVKLSSNYANKQVTITVVDENQVSLSGAQLTYYSKGRATKKRITDGNNPILVLSTEELTETDSIVGNLINYTDGKLTWSSSSECNSTQNLSMVLSPIKGRDRINLGMIYYDFDLWNLRPEGQIELDKLVKYMKEHPDLTVELGSHTDSRGSDYYNEWLAERRSQSCVKYIKKNGVPANKIIAKGYGEKQLVNACADGVKCSEADHQLNRRTTLEIKLD